MIARHKDAYTSRFEIGSFDILHDYKFTEAEEEHGIVACHAWILKPHKKLAKN